MTKKSEYSRIVRLMVLFFFLRMGKGSPAPSRGDVDRLTLTSCTGEVSEVTPVLTLRDPPVLSQGTGQDLGLHRR